MSIDVRRIHQDFTFAADHNDLLVFARPGFTVGTVNLFTSELSPGPNYPFEDPDGFLDVTNRFTPQLVKNVRSSGRDFGTIERDLEPFDETNTPRESFGAPAVSPGFVTPRLLPNEIGFPEFSFFVDDVELARKVPSGEFDFLVPTPGNIVRPSVNLGAMVLYTRRETDPDNDIFGVQVIRMPFVGSASILISEKEAVDLNVKELQVHDNAVYARVGDGVPSEDVILIGTSPVEREVTFRPDKLVFVLPNSYTNDVLGDRRRYRTVVDEDTGSVLFKKLKDITADLLSGPTFSLSETGSFHFVTAVKGNQ